MAISSPRVIPSSGGSGVSHTNAPAQFANAAQDAANLREQKRQFSTNVLMSFAQMDRDTRGMLARRDPDLVESALSEIMGNQEAAELTQGMAEGLLSANQQTENYLAAKTRLGAVQGGNGGGGGQPQPQPQPGPERTPGVDPNVNTPQATPGMMSGQGAESQTTRETHPNPASRGGTLQRAQGPERTYQGNAPQQFEAYDSSQGGFNVPFNQALRAANNILPREGDGGGSGLLSEEDGELKVDWTNFNSRFGKFENGKIQMPEGSSLSREDVYGDLSDEDAFKFRAHADVALQKVQEEIESGEISKENARERYRQLMSPDAVDPNNPTEWFMYDDNLTLEQKREIQTAGEGTVEDMKDRAGIIYEGKMNERAQEEMGDEANTVIQPTNEFINRGNRIRLERTNNSVRDRTGTTTESGEWQINPNLSGEQLIEAVHEVEKTFNITSRRGRPKNEQEAKRRAKNLLNYAESGIQVFTGGETGPEAYVQARNFLNKEGFMEARIAMMQNELEMKRQMNEHQVEQDEMETAFQMLAFKANQQAAQAESEATRRDGFLEALGTTRHLVELTTNDGELNADTLAREWNNNPSLRDGYKAYMNMYADFLKNEGYDVEISTDDISSGFWQSFLGEDASIPTLQWEKDVNPQQATQDVMQNLTPEQQANMQELNSYIYGPGRQ